VNVKKPSFGICIIRWNLRRQAASDALVRSRTGSFGSCSISQRGCDSQAEGVGRSLEIAFL
jgi:hypothetical protein